MVVSLMNQGGMWCGVFDELRWYVVVVSLMN